MVTSIWNGEPPRDGWHWLARLDNGKPRMAFYERSRGAWRVADVMGRTSRLSAFRVARGYSYVAAVPVPRGASATEGG